MSTALPACPSCQSEDVVKNGRTRHDKQNYKCCDCGRQFTLKSTVAHVFRGN
ncbi:IS1 family transposase [Cyanobacteria bacterium FACHB-472]|nr:IS1 family transposase [Cyanobacteria bacterium FACHB-472]